VIFKIVGRALESDGQGKRSFSDQKINKVFVLSFFLAIGFYFSFVGSCICKSTWNTYGHIEQPQRNGIFFLFFFFVINFVDFVLHFF
jgi:hypothetical protein